MSNRCIRIQFTYGSSWQHPKVNPGCTSNTTKFPRFVDVSVSRCWREGQSRGHIHQAGQRVGSHLLHHPAPVRLHRDLGNAELATDLLVQPAGEDQPHDFPFATAERGVALPQRPYLRLMTKCSMAAFDGVSDRTQQQLIADWLRQEIGSSRLQSPDCRRHIAVRRDEDDRHFNSIGDALLQIETIEIWKSNVQYQAAWSQHSWARQEFLRAREDFRLPACAVDQQFQ